MFLIIDITTKNLLLACFSICIVNLTILFLYDFKNAKELGINKTKYSNKVNNTLLKIGFATFVLSFLSQYIINASRYAIDVLFTNDLQTIFGIIIMPATFMGLLCQYVTQPVLTRITQNIKDGKYTNLKKLILKIFAIIIVLGIITFTGTYVLGIPILELIYGIPLSEYLISLLIIIVGSIFYALEMFISTVLIAMRKTSLQALMYLGIAIFSTFISFKLVESKEIIGASLAYFATMVAITLVLLIYMIISIEKNIKQENTKIFETK